MMEPKLASAMIEPTIIIAIGEVIPPRVPIALAKTLGIFIPRRSSAIATRQEPIEGLQIDFQGRSIMLPAAFDRKSSRPASLPSVFLPARIANPALYMKNASTMTKMLANRVVSPPNMDEMMGRPMKAVLVQMAMNR